MGFLNDLFGGSDQAYPTTPTGVVPPPCGDQPFAPPEPDGFFSKLFAPKALTYPMRSCSTGPQPMQPQPTPGTGIVPAVTTPSWTPSSGSTPTPGVVAPASGAPSATSPSPGAPATSGGVSMGNAPTSGGTAAPPTPAAAPASPVTVVISMPGAGTTSPSAPAASTTPAVTPMAPAVTPVLPAVPVTMAPIPSVPPSDPPIIAQVLAPAAPGCKIVCAESLNPRFRAHHPKAFEKALEDMIDENVSVRMITKEAAPLPFVVPEGCDSVHFSYGAIELNPGHGKAGDLDQVVTLGTPTLSADVGSCDTSGVGPLAPGTALVVNVPWRAASFVELPANRLKVTVFAKFFSSAR